ncbi:hypothetical protein ED312_13255 [Sinomicrobium pectinilyticum]|uniref:Uncharacterized protein n=1 Tax=Sinomicrobium pectinilyticum TaxID=1084421 RepID=A0A3N0EAR1_SINP1|nr:hypothetical protein [Sinomicrobium pectinilyticum]RNL84941.1 hypothetical protein ED312_13255 [Sinomicrobium pectinilyticum]
MKYKHKALLYNFICFALVFILTRTALHYFFPGYDLWTAIASAITAMVLAPKFVVVEGPSGEKMFVKWLFLPPKEIK